MAGLFNILKVTVSEDKICAHVLVNPGMPLMTSEDIEATARVYYLVPAIAKHLCLGDSGREFQDCMGQTELCHLLEHVTVELMNETGLAGSISCGRTRVSEHDERVFEVELSCPDDALAIGALPLLYAIVTRVHIPESVRFLEAKGREDEAEKAVRYFEEAGGVAPVTSPKGKPLPKIKTRELFGSKYLARTIAIWATWFFVNFSYYGAFTWMPSLLADQFGSLTKSFGYTLAISIAQLPGYFLAAWLVEVWGRRKTLSIFLAVSAVAAFAFSQAGSVALVLVFGMLLSASNLGAWGVLYAVTPEIYPTRLRGAAAGAAAAVGRIAAIIAPLSRKMGNPSPVWTLFSIQRAVRVVSPLTLYTLEAS